MRELTLDDLDDMVLGATLLGTGGGGDPYIARLMVRQAMEDYGSVNIASPSELDPDGLVLTVAVIAAIVVGGTSIAGGSGAIWRSFVGVFFIAILVNGFNLNGIDPIYQRIIQGVVILLAVGADAFSRSNKD